MTARMLPLLALVMTSVTPAAALRRRFTADELMELISALQEEE